VYRSGLTAMLNRRQLLSRLGCTIALCATSSALAGPQQAAVPLRTTRGGRLMLDIEVNGASVEALLDSGAEMTLLNRAFAEQLDLVATSTETARGSGKGVLEAGIVEGVTLEAAGLVLEDQTVAVIDLTDVATRLLGHPLHAILGRELFDAARLQIDIEGGTLAVVSSSAEPRGTGLPLTSEHGIETFPVRVEGGPPVQAALDLGNGSNVLIGAAYARRAGLLDGRPATRERGGGLGGETEREVIRLKSLEVAGRTFHDVPASIDDQSSATDVNVGVSILRHFVITTDFDARSVWLEPRVTKS